jgi:Fur family ferric uptake transcriptional regulator
MILDPKKLKKAGLKVTVPRMKVFDTLQRQTVETHMTAEQIYKALLEAGEEIGLATVYRVLTQFESAGLVKRHHFEGNQSVFEINRGDHHDHIVCLQCGHIEEFNNELIEEQQRKVSQSLGFELTEHCLILYGNCTRENCPHRS